jgi:hypothetical protein
MAAHQILIFLLLLICGRNTVAAQPAQLGQPDSLPYKPGWTPIFLGLCPDMQVTSIEGQRRAVQQALELAIERSCGVGIMAIGLLNSDQLVSNTTLFSQAAFVANYVVIQKGVDLKSLDQIGYQYQQISYWVQLACSLVCPESMDKSKVNLRVTLTPRTYRSGESGTLIIEAFDDCYITIFNY